MSLDLGSIHPERSAIESMRFNDVSGAKAEIKKLILDCTHGQGGAWAEDLTGFDEDGVLRGNHLGEIRMLTEVQCERRKPFQAILFKLTADGVEAVLDTFRPIDESVIIHTLGGWDNLEDFGDGLATSRGEDLLQNSEEPEAGSVGQDCLTSDDSVPLDSDGPN